MNDFTFYVEIKNIIEKYQKNPSSRMRLPNDISPAKLAEFVVDNLKLITNMLQK